MLGMHQDPCCTFYILFLSLLTKILAIAPSNRWDVWSSDRLGHFPMAAQTVNSIARILIQHLCPYPLQRYFLIKHHTLLPCMYISLYAIVTVCVLELNVFSSNRTHRHKSHAYSHTAGLCTKHLAKRQMHRLMKAPRVQLTTDALQLIAAITTVIIIVTFPLLWDAVPIEAGELGTVTPCTVVHDAMLFVVGQIPVALVWTLALSTSRTLKKIGPESKRFV